MGRQISNAERQLKLAIAFVTARFPSVLRPHIQPLERQNLHRSWWNRRLHITLAFANPEQPHTPPQINSQTSIQAGVLAILPSLKPWLGSSSSRLSPQVGTRWDSASRQSPRYQSLGSRIIHVQDFPFRLHLGHRTFRPWKSEPLVSQAILRWFLLNKLWKVD